ERGANSTLRALATTLVTLPRAYPIRWAIAWTALLIGLILAPSRVLPVTEKGSVEKIIPYGDLAVHSALFVGFVVSWIRVRGAPLRWGVAPVVGLLLGAATEYAQGLPFIDRDPNLIDGLADVVGVLGGLIAAAVFYRTRPRPVPTPALVVSGFPAC